MWLLWGLFALAVITSLAFDLGSGNGAVSVRAALLMSAAWICAALAFDVVLWLSHGSKVALEFLAAFVLEKGLSIDNVFVFLVVFQQAELPERLQRRVLKWGILGALCMRALFIAGGIQLLRRFHWLLALFGLLLLGTGLRLFFATDEEEAPPPAGLRSENPVIRLIRRCVPYVDDYGGGHFFIRVKGESKTRYYATRLFFVLLSIELMDALFALDSIPAILSLTDDPLVVYTSNIFAILGLRALFFALAGMLHEFPYLKTGLSIILLFVGFKMVVGAWWKLPILPALGFILSVLIVSVVASLWHRRGSQPRTRRDETDAVIISL